MKLSILTLFFGLLILGNSQSLAQENGVLPTKLQITVLNGLGNKVVGAKVSIYESEEDYLGDKNVVGTAMVTDTKGRVTFKDLLPKVYYIFARKDSMDNADGNQSTGKLKKGVKNKVIVVIND